MIDPRVHHAMKLLLVAIGLIVLMQIVVVQLVLR